MFYYLSITLSKARARTYAQFYLSLSFSVAKPVLLTLFVNIIHRGLPYLSSTHTHTHALARHALSLFLPRSQTHTSHLKLQFRATRQEKRPSIEKKRGTRDRRRFLCGWVAAAAAPPAAADSRFVSTKTEVAKMRRIIDLTKQAQTRTQSGLAQRHK